MNNKEILLNNLDKKKYAFKITREIIYPLLAILIPLIICYFLFKTNNFYPFKEDGNTVLMIDAQGQYIAYFRYFKTLLEEGDSFLYTLSKTFGGNFLSLYTYYLSSPFNFLIVFFSYEDIPLFFLITAVIKMLLASLFMYLFLKFIKKKISLSYLIFSISYGLCSYFFVYLFSPMWLDGVMILPLVALGIYKLVKKEDVLIYPLSLCYALLTSWYIGFMICIFSVFFFFATYYAFRNKKSLLLSHIDKNHLILRFFILSLLGGLLASPLWISAFLHFNGTKASGFSFSYDQGLTMNLESIFSSFLTYNYQSTSYICETYHYMAAFSSLPALVFAITFFFSKERKLNYRLSYLILFLAYLLLTSLSVTYTLMHGGSAPTWFPTRYSFIFAFLICFYGCEGFSSLKKTPLLAYLLPSLGGALVLYLIIFVPDSHGNTYPYSLAPILIYFSTIFLGFIGSLLYKLKLKKAPVIVSSFSLILLGSASYSIYLGEDNILKTNIEDNSYVTQEEYLKDLAFQKDVDTIQDYDSSLYRMENTFIREGSYNGADNDPMFYSYNGISHYSSVEKKNVMEYLEKIGFFYNGFNEGYDGGSTVSMNSYLGIKYLIDNNTQNVVQFLDSLTELPLTSENNMSFYENQYALPLAFTTSPNGATYIGEGVSINNETYWYSHFEYQNEIFKAMSDQVIDEKGNKKDIFKKIDYTINTSFGTTYQKEGQYTYFTNKNDNSTVTFTFTIPEEAKDNNLYFMFKDKDSDLRIYLDNRYINCMSYSHAGIRSFKGKVKSTHTLRVQIPKEIDHYRLEPEIYYEDLSILNKYVTAIKKDEISNLHIEHDAFSYKITGTLNLNNDNRYLLFTLPFEENMNIYIDNKKMNTFTRFNIFTSCDITNLNKGEHKIELIIKDNGLNIGLVLSALAIVGLVSYSIFFFRRK